MRIVFAERRTLPSRTAPTLSLWATVAMSGCSLKENEEVRAATCSSLISASELSSCSVSPPEKYSCSLSPLRFTNGSTAIECRGGLKAAAAPGSAVVRDAGSPADVPGWRETQNLPATRYASAAQTTTVTITSSTDSDLRDARTGSLIAGAAPDTALTGESCGNSRRFIRSTKAGGVSPPGRRLHCTRRNDSGTSAATSLVVSRHTGTTNTRLRAIMWVR